MFDVAPHFRALLVFIEHRFYGKSIPFGGITTIAYSNASTLGYLSSSEALADYATLIIDLKKNLTAEDSPVVVFGGSYGGMLAAWFRLKYPHVAVGALASSAPILDFENITSPYLFNEITTNDFRGESENCYKVIKGSWQQIDDTAKHPGGLELLRKSFGICENPLLTAGSIQGWLAAAYRYTAKMDYPTPSNFLNPLPAYPVKHVFLSVVYSFTIQQFCINPSSMCKAIDNPVLGNSTIFANLHAATNIFYNYTGKTNCFDLFEDSDPHGLAEWSWQACTEMIMPLGSSNQESVFPVHEWNYSARAMSCRAAFGVEPRPYWISAEFGGHDIYRHLKRFGSNIIFFNGLRDPWSSGGVLRNIPESIVAIVAKEGAHHVDLRFATSEDPLWLQEVRKREVRIIDKWLSGYYNDLTWSPN